MGLTNKVALSVLIMALTSGCSKTETVDDYLVKAKQQISNNNYEATVIELKNAIKVAPENAEARFLLGQAYLSVGQASGAVKEFEQAKAKGYSLDKVLPLLARAYLLYEKNDDILALNSEVETLSAESKTQYYALRVLASLKLSNHEEANNSLKAAMAADDVSVYTVLAKSYIAFADGDLDQALAGVAQVLSSQSENHEALLLRGQIALSQEEYAVASDYFAQYAKLQPYSIIIHMYLADSYVKQKNYVEAAKEADYLLKLNPEHGFANYIKAIASYEAKDYQAAYGHAEKAISSNNQDTSIKLVAGASAFQLANFQQSYHYLSMLKSVLPAEHPARKMLAVSELKLGLVNELSDTLANVDVKTEQDAELLSSFSNELLAMGQIEQAKEINDKITESLPNDAKQQAKTGVLKIMMNDFSGIEDLEKAVEINPDFKQAELALALAEYKNNNKNKAITLAEQWQAKYVNEVEGFNFIALIHLRDKNTKLALTFVEKSLAVQPDNLIALLYRSQVSLVDNNKPESIQWAQKALDLHPNNATALRYFYTLSGEDALNKIITAAKANPTNLELNLLHARVLYNEGEFNKIESALSGFKADAKMPNVYWQLLVGTFNKLNLVSKTQITLQNWVDISHYKHEAVSSLLQFYEREKDFKAAINLVTNAKKQHPKVEMYDWLYIQLLINDRRFSEAKLSLDKLVENDKNKVIRQGLAGQIALFNKDYATAVPLLKAFYEKSVNSRNAALLAAALNGNQQTDKAIIHLEKYLSAHENDLTAQQLLATYYVNVDSSKAISMYEKINNGNEKDIISLNNLAWLHLQKGDVEKAVSYSKAAYDLAPEMPNVVDTYGMAMLKANKTREALPLLLKADELSKGTDVDIRLNYVEVLIANARKNEAKDILATVKPQTKTQIDRVAVLKSQL